MKALLLAACLLTLPGGDREKGLQLYGEGRFADAAAAFRSAIESEGDSADLQWNLALASWRAGDLATAETAAEKYAAMTKDARVDLHRGLLGAVRHGEAKLLEAEADTLLGGTPPAAAADPAAQPPQPLPVLERALEKAVQARDHFVAAAAANGSPELLRNVERALRYVEELQKKIDELKQQQQQQDEKSDEQKKDEQKDDQQKGEQKKDDQQKSDEQQKQDQQKQDEQQKQDGQPQDQQPQEPQQGEERPEPKAEEPSQQSEQGAPEPKPADQAPEPKPEDQKRSDAPGEAAEGKELSPEQAQRLLEQLKDLDQKLKSIRARAKSGRRPVERDW